MTASSGLTVEPIGWRTDGSGSYPEATPPRTWAADKNVSGEPRCPAGATPRRSSSAKSSLSARSLPCCCASTCADGKILWQKENSYQDVVLPRSLEAAAGRWSRSRRTRSSSRFARPRWRWPRPAQEAACQPGEQGGVAKEARRTQGPDRSFQAQAEGLSAGRQVPHARQGLDRRLLRPRRRSRTAKRLRRFRQRPGRLLRPGRQPQMDSD